MSTGSGYTPVETTRSLRAALLVPAVIAAAALAAATLASCGDSTDFDPVTPSGLVAGANAPDEVELAWVDSSPDAPTASAWFVVQRKPLHADSYEEIGAAPGDASGYVDPYVLPNGIYQYRVAEASPSWVSPFTEPVTITTSGLWAPAAPSHPCVRLPLYDGSFTVTWLDRSFNEDGFVLERRLSGSTFAGIESLPADSVSATDPGTDLVSGSVYEYRVKAVNDYGDSDYSSTLSVEVNHEYQVRTLLEAASPANEDDFGAAVAMTESHAVIGCPRSSDIANNAGVVVVYARDVGGWTSPLVLTPDAGLLAWDYFGGAVALDGNLLAVGAVYDGLNSTGAVYAFELTPPNTWDGGTKLIASDPTMGDLLGSAVAISGDYLAAGASGVGEPNSGAIYVFRRLAAASWDAGFKLTPASEQSGDVLDLDGDYLVAGDADGEQAFVYHRSGPDNVWDAGVEIVLADPVTDDWFGYGVAITGDLLAVGAPQREVQGIDDAGEVYLYERTGTNAWTLDSTLTAPTPTERERFGNAIRFSGSLLIVGAMGSDGSYDSDPVNGSAYLFEADGTGGWNHVLTFEGVREEGPYTWKGFGTDVAVSSTAAFICPASESFGSPGFAYRFH